MKKIFTLITVMLVAMSAMAQDLKSTDYHDQLVITIMVRRCQQNRL